MLEKEVYTKYKYSIGFTNTRTHIQNKDDLFK